MLDRQSLARTKKSSVPTATLFFKMLQASPKRFKSFPEGTVLFRFKTAGK